MKKWLLSLGVMALLAQSALAFAPSGWVYSNYPWAYDSGSGDWYWFSTDDTQWIANMGSGQWATLLNSALASGWCYYNGSFVYAQSNGAWHWVNDADTQRVVNMRTGEWSQWGTQTGSGINWYSSRSDAVQNARDNGRLVLLVAGRPACWNCQYMKDTICEIPAVRSVIDLNYSCWFCDIDESTEWYSYASGLGSFTLPLVCVIDPDVPLSYLDRTTGIQAENVFQNRLESHLPPPIP
jgi:hypothetical protein